MSNHHHHHQHTDCGGDEQVELPALEDLTPLTQSLITPELAGAFSIKSPTYVLQASQATVVTSLWQQQQSNPGSLFSVQGDDADKAAASGVGYGFAADGGISHALEAIRGQEAGVGLGVCDSSNDGSAKKPKQVGGDADSEETDSGNSGDDPSARTLKRPRLVWTPQLHKRFVDAVAQLGIKSAVPKTIMQLMNVEGLTRENVASHLQKYRLYLKRMQEGPPSASDPLFASTPVPPALAAQAHFLQGHDMGSVPFAMNAVAGLGPGPQMAMYPGFDHHAFATIARGAQQRMPSGDYREMPNMENHSQPGSPPRRVLTLFPSNRN